MNTQNIKGKLNILKVKLPNVFKFVIIPIVLLSVWMYIASHQSEPFYPELNAVLGGNFADVNRILTEKELDSLTGWTANDYLPLTYFLDNKQNFQLGVIETVRFSVRVLRDNLSRQRTTDQIDTDVKKAFEFYSNDPHKWIFPSYESRLRKGSKSLESYTERLNNGSARFYPRSDNLIQLMTQYSSLLGSATTGLLDKDLSWTETDNRFYYSKGIAYAMHIEMLAVQKDFQKILKKNDGEELISSIISELDATWFEPTVVLNCGKDDVFANHLRNISSELLRIRQKINSLISVLSHSGQASAG